MLAIPQRSSSSTEPSTLLSYHRNTPWCRDLSILEQHSRLAYETPAIRSRISATPTGARGLRKAISRARLPRAFAAYLSRVRAARSPSYRRDRCTSQQPANVYTHEGSQVLREQNYSKDTASSPVRHSVYVCDWIGDSLRSSVPTRMVPSLATDHGTEAVGEAEDRPMRTERIAVARKTANRAKTYLKGSDRCYRVKKVSITS